MAGAEILRPPVYRITLAQLVILVLLCLFLLASDKVRAYSAQTRRKRPDIPDESG